MKEIIFVIGGCRSGKSSHALTLAEEIPGNRKIFIATCVPYDDEMTARVRKHQQERSRAWTTLEVPIALGESIAENSPKTDVIVADCLTLWASNLVLENTPSEKIAEALQTLTHALKTAQCPVILVSNEVGCGIVPENALARTFRDIAGAINQRAAECADRVIWMVAGIPVVIKTKPSDKSPGYKPKPA